MPKSLTIRHILAQDNLTLVDAKKDVVLHVKQCDMGIKKSPERCVFANACRREFKGLKRAIFTRSVAYLQTNGKLVRYVLSSRVRQEIMAFDRGGKLAVGEYILQAPSKRNKLGTKRHPGKGRPHRQRAYVPRTRIADIRDMNW